MNKQQLLELIQSMPEDLFCNPLNYEEQGQVVHDWTRCPPLPDSEVYNAYKRDIDNTLVLRIDFRTTVRGEFRRGINDPDGTFYNVVRLK